MTIDLENICKSYGDIKVLDNFNLEIADEHAYVITGDSGKGKTTLIRILLGLEQPDSGRVHLMGDYKYAYLNAGVVFQEDRLCEDCSAVQNVVMVNKKNSVTVAREELQKLLPADCIDKPVREMSELSLRGDSPSSKIVSYISRPLEPNRALSPVRNCCLISMCNHL